jgi:hypothetical protein
VTVAAEELAAEETAPVSGRTAIASRALQLTRAGYGMALVLAPGVLIYLATGRFPSRRARRVAQVLGARHLVQAAVTAFVPVPDVFALGAEADIVHAASMVLLAPAGGTAGRAAALDTLAEAAFAATGWGAGAQRGGGEKAAFSCGRAAGT